MTKQTKKPIKYLEINLLAFIKNIIFAFSYSSINQLLSIQFVISLSVFTWKVLLPMDLSIFRLRLHPRYQYHQCSIQFVNSLSVFTWKILLDLLIFRLRLYLRYQYHQQSIQSISTHFLNSIH